MADKKKPEPPVLFYLRGGGPDLPRHDLTQSEADALGGVGALVKIVPPVYSPDPPAAYYLGGTTGGYHAGVPDGNLTADEVKAAGGWDFLNTGDPLLYSPDPPKPTGDDPAGVPVTPPVALPLASPGTSATPPKEEGK